ncbi:MAG: hypothetical protein IJF39_01225 [Clostridia bacterium]|nr:hypothetical protein [Clostridia bacterium]
MKKWKLLQSIVGVLLGLLIALFIFRIALLPYMQSNSLEEMMEAAGGWGWLIAIIYPLVQHTWLLLTLAVLLIAASLYCKVMEIREDGFHPIKLITTVIFSIATVAVMVYLLIQLYAH